MDKKPSLLERAARAIEPADTAPKSVARRHRTLREIAQSDKTAAKVFRPGEPPRALNSVTTLLNGDPRRFYSDGSLRRDTRKLTPQERRAKKRAKRT